MCLAINNLLLSIPRGPDKRSVREHNLRAAAAYGIISLQLLKCVEVEDNPGTPWTFIRCAIRGIIGRRSRFGVEVSWRGGRHRQEIMVSLH
jgi:hypothetical protein